MSHFTQRRVACGILLAIVVSVGAGAAERQLGLEPSARQVKRCEKIEFTLNVAAVADDPYDPDEIAADLELTAPSGKKIVVPAFYCQPYERQRREQGRNKGEWMYPAGNPVWKARFAPAETGAYSCVASLRDRAGAVRSAAVTFDSLPSADKGFVRVSSRDPRYLAFEDGSPFFAIGQNVAFIRDVYDAAEILRKMAAQGANYARVWACCEDWAMGVEARKSVWGRSWSWNPPIVAMPGREGYHSDDKCVRIAGDAGASVEVSPTRPLGLRPNTAYAITGMVRAGGGAALSIDIGGAKDIKPIAGKSEWTRFRQEFATSPDQWWLTRFALRLSGKGSVWLRDLSLKEAKGGPELLWEADVNRPVRGFFNPVDCFMLDNLVEAAEQSGIYLQLTMLTRDHYMSLLNNDKSRAYDEAIRSAKRLYRYSVARWGYSTHVAAWEYFNEMNPGLPTDRFYAEVGKYLEQTDPYRHVRANSCWGPSKKDWQHPQLDTADLHYYLRPVNGDLFKDAVAAVSDRSKFLREAAPNKPAFLNEYGMCDDKWQLSPHIRDDVEYVHLHDGLWTSALSGLSGACLSWHWEELEKRNMYRHYRPLADFVADVPFTTAGLQAARVEASEKALRVLGLQGKACAYLWISNPQATWYKIGVDKITPAQISGATLALDGLEPGAYRVQWWDTWTGKSVGEERVQAAASNLSLKVPAFSRDIACKVVR